MYNQVSITKSGLVTGGKESKEDKLFSSHLLIHSEVMHMNKKNQVTKIPCTGKIVTCARLWIAILADEVKCHYCASVSTISLYWQSYWWFRWSSRVAKDPDTKAWTENNSQRHVGSTAAATAAGNRWLQVIDEAGLKKNKRLPALTALRNQ